MPIAVKDALATHDAPTTAGSRILLRRVADPPDPRDGYVPPYDATVVARLRAADAVIVGKTNMDELAMGSSNENSAFFPARNPHDPSRTAGGSSGGSAVAVAAGMTPVAIGSDTGGSIRQPAALTGVVGVKPTYGRVSRYGLFAFASSLDQVGTFARDVRSAAAALQVIAGPDERDGTTEDRPATGFDPGAQEGDLLEGARGGRLRVGLPRETFEEGVAPAVRARVLAAADEPRARRGGDRGASSCRPRGSRSPPTTCSRRPRPRATSRDMTACASACACTTVEPRSGRSIGRRAGPGSGPR